jgi:hypothetical protein
VYFWHDKSYVFLSGTLELMDAATEGNRRKSETDLEQLIDHFVLVLGMRESW